jgi:hypothetical protein
MIELLIFLLPIITAGIGIYQKTILDEGSAISFVDYANKHGAKARTLKSPRFFLQLTAYIISPLYIGFGWVWMILGVILLVWMGVYFLFGDEKTVTPNLCSSDFDKLVLKRRKQAMVSSVVMIIWIASWVVEYS